MSDISEDASDTFDELETQEWVDRIADAFEQKWKGSPNPPIASFLKESTGQRRWLLLCELLRIDLEHRYRRGDPVRLEDYLDDFPELSEPGQGLPDELIMFAKRMTQRHGQKNSLRDDLANAEPDFESSTRTVKCPHCQQPVDISANATDRSTVCPQCAGSIEIDATAMVQGAKLRLPRTIGKFQLLEFIGSGSFGTVFKARDSELARIVAIKFPRPGLLQDSHDEQRFLREARASAALRHPNIVQLHEVGREEGIPYIVSDFVDGQTLDSFVAEKPLSHRECAEYACEIAKALHHAHQHQVVHRDVKPSNILVDEKGHAFVADFGLARQANDRVQMTVDGQVLGTPAYMSPEQAMGESSTVDARSDVFSLGVVLYELLTAERPFRGNVRMLLQQVVNDEPRPPRQLNDRIPRDLETICLKAMSKERTRRYHTAQEFADDLQRFLDDKPILARPIGALERTRQWCRRNKRLAGTYATATAIVLIVTLAAFIRVNDARKVAVYEKEKASGLAGRLAEQLRTSEHLRTQAEVARHREAAARLDAERQTRRATSNRLVVQSQHQTDLEPRLLLATAAVESTFVVDGEVDPIAHQNLREALRQVSGWPVSAESPVTSLLRGPNRWAATGHQDGTVKLWDLRQLSPYATAQDLEGLSGAVDRIAISPARDWVVASSGTEVMSWELDGRNQTRSTVRLKGHEVLRGPSHDAAARSLALDLQGVRSIALCSQARRLATLDSLGTVRVWDLNGESPSECLLNVSGNEDIWSPEVTWSANGHWLVVTTQPHVADGSFFKVIRLFDLSKPATDKDQIILTNSADDMTDWELDPSGRWLAAFSSEKVWCWDLSQTQPQKLRFLYWSGEQPIRDVTFDRQSRRMLVSRYAGSSQLFDMTSASPSRSRLDLGYRSELQEFSSDGKWLAGAREDTLQLWNCNDLKASPIEIPCYGLTVSRIAFTADSSWFICEWSDGAIRKYNLNKNDVLTDVRTVKKWNAALSQGESALWSISEAKVPRLIDLENTDPVSAVVLRGHNAIPEQYAPTNGPFFQLELRGEIRKIFLDESASLAVSEGADDTVRLWDLSSAYPSRSSIVLSRRSNRGLIGMSSNGKWIATAGERENEILMWQVKDPRNEQSLRKHASVLHGHTGTVLHVLFSADSKTLLSADSEGTLLTWNMHAKEMKQATSRTEGLGKITCMATDNTNDWLLVGTESGVVHKLRLQASNVTKSSSFTAHEDAVTAISMGLDGSSFLTAGLDGRIKIWSLKDPDEQPTVIAHDGGVRTGVLSPNGRWVAAAGHGDSCYVWDLKSATPEKVIAKVDGRVVAFDPSTRWFICGDQLWDLHSPNPFKTPVVLNGHTGETVSVAVSSDGRFIATGNTDRTTRIWPLAIEELLAHARRAAGRDFTRQEKQEFRLQLPKSTSRVNRQ